MFIHFTHFHPLLVLNVGVERERNQVFVRKRDILLLSLAYRYYRHTGCNCQENEQEDSVLVYFYLKSESDSLKSIQRFTNFPVFFLPDIRYRLSRNRNLKYGNRISRSGTNTWFLFRSTPIPNNVKGTRTKPT